MQKKNVTTFLFLMLTGLVWFLPVPASAEIKLGILPRLSALELHAMFNPLAEYLSRETGEKVSLVIPKDFEAYKTAVLGGHIDIGFANSLIYVQLKKKAPGLQPLAVGSEYKSGARFRGIIIARKDSGIYKVTDLKGKKLIFVDRDSAAGYVFQMLLLSKAGMNLEKDFITLPFAKKHDNVTMAVFSRAADAGGIREDDLEKMKDKVDLSQLRIVAYTDYFPNWPLFSTPRLDRVLEAKIKAALLKLKPDDPASGKVLGSAQLTGFGPVTDKQYDELRKAARLVDAL